MTLFEKIRESATEEARENTERCFNYIVNGFGEDKDRGLLSASTDRRAEQYINGEITREEAVNFAKVRTEKKNQKNLDKVLHRIGVIEAEKDIDYFTICVDFKRSRTWGWNPVVSVYDCYTVTDGTASGCGYDKESAAVADALNQNPRIVKILCSIKEQALSDGISDRSENVVTGRDNRSCCGYGAGYSAVPYFEGGVGVDCFFSILSKAGFKVRRESSKTRNFYTLYKEA